MVWSRQHQDLQSITDTLNEILRSASAFFAAELDGRRPR
jgi:hypothetical protein